MSVLYEDEWRRIISNNPDLVARNPELVIEKVPRERKYHNQPMEYNGRRYDSIKEAQYARTLDLEMQIGEVICWAPQVDVILQPGIKYRADFLVLRKDWKTEIIDVKGGDATKTSTYRLKRKMFKARFGKDIKEV